jgi:hypothetical protein
MTLSEESNLENEDQIKTKCHYLFYHHLPNLGTRFILRGVELSHPKNLKRRKIGKI